jgi:hypothetical protein
LATRGPYCLTEADYQHTNLYCVVIGVTSKGRKGTSWSRIRDVLKSVDADWVASCQISGLGSGEALIEALSKQDQRRLVFESEFARLLAVMAREGTTISSIFRQCWDTGEAHVTVRREEAHVTNGHLSLIAHVTKDELLRRLTDTEIANGFGNRILWCCAKRSKELPFGGGSINYGNAPGRLEKATRFTRQCGNTRFEFDSAARELWRSVYHDLSEGRPGLFGAVTGRAEAQVIRLALIYALLDCAEAQKIRIEHLRAALTIWAYCEASARYVWRDALGDPTADDILRALRNADSQGMTRADIYNHFSRHKPAEELDRATAVLIERGLIRFAREDTPGRTLIRY